jgi:hypothetical protein
MSRPANTGHTGHRRDGVPRLFEINLHIIATIGLGGPHSRAMTVRESRARVYAPTNKCGDGVAGRQGGQWFVRSFSERRLSEESQCEPRWPATPGDFGPLPASTALRRNPRQAPSPDPL